MAEATAPAMPARLSGGAVARLSTGSPRLSGSPAGSAARAVEAQASGRPSLAPRPPVFAPGRPSSRAATERTTADGPASRPLLGRAGSSPPTLGSELFDSALLFGLVAAVIAAVTLLVLVLHGWS